MLMLMSVRAARPSVHTTVITHTAHSSAPVVMVTFWSLTDTAVKSQVYTSCTVCM